MKLEKRPFCSSKYKRPFFQHFSLKLYSHENQFSFTCIFFCWKIRFVYNFQGFSYDFPVFSNFQNSIKTIRYRSLIASSHVHVLPFISNQSFLSLKMIWQRFPLILVFDQNRENMTSSTSNLPDLVGFAMVKVKSMIMINWSKRWCGGYWKFGDGSSIIGRYREKKNERWGKK